MFIRKVLINYFKKLSPREVKTFPQSTSELMAELGLQDMSCEPQGNTVPGPPPAPLHPFLLEQSSTKGP